MQVSWVIRGRITFPDDGDHSFWYHPRQKTLYWDRDYNQAKKWKGKYQEKHHFVHIGCFADRSPRAICGTVTNYAAHEAIEKCFERARREGNEYFSVQYKTRCFTSRSAGDTYNKYGAASGCENGRGGMWKNSVYRIPPTQMMASTQQPIQCGWKKYPKACVMGHNLKKYLGMKKSLSECKSLCAEHEDCVAVEYGVNYHGRGYPRAGDCLLQSSVNMDHCDGGHWNLDLHVKPVRDCGAMNQTMNILLCLFIACFFIFLVLMLYRPCV